MRKFLGVDINVFLLGLVSFLTDVSSESIFSVFSIFFVVILGASTVLLGLIEGLADFASSSLDYVSGVLSDRTGKRKLLSGFGYGFSTVAKTILLFANTVVLASVFRVVERLGKSFRGPPRDSWLASLATSKNRGLSFGIHKALDKAGAVVGPLIAYLILSYAGQTMHTFKVIFLIALVPAVLAVALLGLIHEKPAARVARESIFKSYKELSKGYKHYLRAAGLFSIAYFSFSFLMLKAYLVGFSIKDIVLLYALFNLAFVVASTPVGRLGDYIGRKSLIALEYCIYAAMSIGFIFATARWHIIVLFIMFGIFYAIDEGQSKAYIADTEERKGTAIGLYNFVTGVVYLPASLIAGWLWTLNPNYAFIFGAAVSIAALLYFSGPFGQPRTVE